MSQQYSNYLEQIDSLAALLSDETQRLSDKHRLSLKVPDVYGIRQIIITGSGDSYIAGLAAAPAIRAWTGLPVQVMVSMEASRYVDAGVPPLAGRNRGLLVVAVSNSGEAARLVEATQRLRNLGALTLALTGNPQSRLGKAAEVVSEVIVPPSANAPGTRSYLASLISLYLLGLRLAEILMCVTMDDANAMRREIAELSGPLGSVAKSLRQPIATLADAWATSSVCDCLGSGPSLGSASFAAAKLVEAAGLHASSQDAEEFHHLNYFVADVTAPALVFAPGNALSAARSKELCATLAGLGRPFAVVTDDATMAGQQHVLNVPRVREWFAPIVHAVPASLLAAEFAERRGVVHYRGHTGPWSGAVGANLVRNSPIDTSRS